MPARMQAPRRDARIQTLDDGLGRAVNPLLQADEISRSY